MYIKANYLTFYKLSDEEREIPIVLVEMDGNENFKHSVSNEVKNLIPFYAKAGACTIKEKYIRYQLPLLLAFARIAHSVQGVTAHYGVVVEPDSTFFAGDYVAISRATSLDLLIMLAPIKYKSFSLEPEFRTKVNNFYEDLHMRYSNDFD